MSTCVWLIGVDDAALAPVLVVVQFVLVPSEEVVQFVFAVPAVPGSFQAVVQCRVDADKTSTVSLDCAIAGSVHKRISIEARAVFNMAVLLRSQTCALY